MATGILPGQQAMLDAWILSVSSDFHAGNLAEANLVLPSRINIAAGLGGLHLFDFGDFIGAVTTATDVPGPVEQRELIARLYRFFHDYAKTDPSFDLSTLYPSDNTKLYAT